MLYSMTFFAQKLTYLSLKLGYGVLLQGVK